ncbi:MAG: YecA family protein [Opitutaceae bacterium]
MDYETSTYEIFTQGLTHEDRIVRDTCLSYLMDQPVKTLEQTRAILEGLEAHGYAHFTYLYMLEGFPLDQPALKRVLELCREWYESAEKLVILRLVRWAGKAAGHEVGQVIEFLECCSGPSVDDLLSVLRERQLIWQLSAETALERLNEAITSMVDSEGYPSNEIYMAEQIIDYLRLEHPSEHLEALAIEWLCLEVDDDEQGSACWKVGLAIYMCGQLGLVQQQDRIMSLFSEYADWYNESIAQALRAFDSVDVLRVVHERWDSYTTNEILYFSGLFETFSVEGLEDFYREQMDHDALDYLECSRFAMGYANFGTEEALCVAQTYLETHPENVELCELMRVLYTHYQLRGVEHTASERILEFIQAEEARIKAHQNRFTNPFLSALSKSAPVPAAAPVQAAASSRPVVRESPKVGRNDPCPCGSGKKYKKCCL